MEDVPPTSPGSLAAQRAPPVASGHSTTAALLPTQSPTASVLPHQLHGAPSSNVFVTEFGMAQSSLGRGGPFYMNVMAAAVPHAGYQPPYGVAVQPQHGFYPLYPGASTPPQLFQSPQYAIHNIPVPNPAYYQQQGPTVSQYHPIQVYQPQSPPESSQTRQSGWYGQGQMSPASYAYPPTAVYYYPTNATFAAPVPPPPPPPQMPIHNTPVPPSVDPRTAPPPIAAGSSGHGLSYPTRRPPRPKTDIAEPDTMDSRQTVSRGPPRRPKQRGEWPPSQDDSDTSNTYIGIRICDLDRESAAPYRSNESCQPRLQRGTRAGIPLLDLEKQLRICELQGRADMHIGSTKAP